MKATSLHAAIHRYLFNNTLEGALPDSWSTLTALQEM